MCTHSTALHACGADIRACLWHVGVQSDTVASAAMAVAYWSGLNTKDRRESSVGGGVVLYARSRNLCIKARLYSA